MSQRTRARTTGAAAKPTNPSDESPARDEASDQPRRGKQASAASAAPALQPDALARALRAVATELERDPALAERVAQAINGATPAEPTVKEQKRAVEADEPPAATIGRSFHPSIVTGIDDALGPGVPDPFALRERLGEAGLREALATLRMGSLRAIVREHGLDPDGSLSKLNDAAKLRAHILKEAGRKRK